MGLIIGAVMLLAAGIGASLYLIWTEKPFPEVGKNSYSLFGRNYEALDSYYPDLHMEEDLGMQTGTVSDLQEEAASKRIQDRRLRENLLYEIENNNSLPGSPELNTHVFFYPDAGLY